MGLPMFREEDDSDNKPASRVDPTAAARSLIRRSRPARIYRTRSNHASTAGPWVESAEARLNRLREMFPLSEFRRRQESSRTAVVRHAVNVESTPFRRHGAPAELRQPHDIFSAPRENPRPSLSATNPARDDDFVLHEPLPGSLVLERLGQSSAEFLFRRHRDTPNDNGFLPIDPALQSMHHASLTPRFAPAYQLGASNDVVPPSQSRISLRTGPIAGNGNPPRYPPPLRRVGHRHITDAPLNRGHRTGIDGLGDRERSFSPDTDAWETLLTTMTPDTQLPSTDTSFTSNAASNLRFSRNAPTAPMTDNAHSPSRLCPLLDSLSDTSSSSVDEDIESANRRLSRTNLISRRTRRREPQIQDSQNLERALEVDTQGSSSNSAYQELQDVLRSEAQNETGYESMWSGSGGNMYLGEHMQRALGRNNR